MPPNRPLSPERFDLVLDWVELGCPETPEDAAANCSAPAPSVALGTPPASAPDPGPVEPPQAGGPTVIEIDRARLRDGLLELRGEVSSAAVSLTAEFDDRTEPVRNDGGDFREEFRVATNPELVTVKSSDGASATIAVEAD